MDGAASSAYSDSDYGPSQPSQLRLRKRSVSRTISRQTTRHSDSPSPPTTPHHSIQAQPISETPLYPSDFVTYPDQLDRASTRARTPGVGTRSQPTPSTPTTKKRLSRPLPKKSKSIQVNDLLIISTLLVLFLVLYSLSEINSNLKLLLLKEQVHQDTTLKTIRNSFLHLQAELETVRSSLELRLDKILSHQQRLHSSLSNVNVPHGPNLADHQADTLGFWATLNKVYFGVPASEESDNNPNDKDYSHVLPRWRKLYNKFRLDFPSQSKEFWTQLGAAVEATMSHLSPPKPSSIIILSSPSTNQDRATCFAKKLAQAINTAFHEPTTHIAEYSVDKFDDFKSVSAIHDSLIQYLKTGKAVLVENIDQFQEKSYLYLFHAFCENSNGLAHDTRATFLFTLRPPHSLATSYDWTHWNGAQIARASLRLAWESVLSEDKREAVISRVSGNVLLYNDADDCSMQS